MAKVATKKITVEYGMSLELPNKWVRFATTSEAKILSGSTAIDVALIREDEMQRCVNFVQGVADEVHKQTKRKKGGR